MQADMQVRPGSDHETNLRSQSAVVGLWVVGVVILVYIKVISVLLTKGHCHVLVVIGMVCWYTTWSYNDFTSICSLQSEMRIQHAFFTFFVR